MYNTTHITKNLSVSEVACKCGCGFNTISKELALRFQDARELFGEAIIVNSGCRCVKHNASESVGGSPTSTHLHGMALDVTCKNPTLFRLFKLGICLAWAGFDRIGVHVVKKFFHVDVDSSRGRGVVFEY